MAVAGSLLAAACNSTDARQPQTAEQETIITLTPSDVAVARVSDISSGVVLTGTLQPKDSVALKAQVAGTIQNLRVDRGTPVKKGQVLATIEARGVQSEAAGARVALSAAQANLAAAERQLAGAKTLHDAGAMSDVDFEAARAQYQAAQAQVASAQAQVASAAEQARRTTVVSPLTGVVSERPVNEGEPVTVGEPLMTIVNPDTLELSGQIPVGQAALIRVGQPVHFTLDAYPEEEFTGRVARVDPVADPATRQIGAALELPNPGRRLVAGQFVTGRVVTANVGRALQVPRSAIRTQGEKRTVLVVNGETVEEKTVTTGMSDSSSGMVVITSGLEEGAQVITTAAANLQPGAKVRVAQAGGAAPPASS
jgi:RND family efflux transporter MFP subunit